MSNLLTEQDVLQQLDIPNFLHITKDKVMPFVNLVPNMELGLANKALEQFVPESAKMVFEALKVKEGIMKKTLDANLESNNWCFDIIKNGINDINSCPAKDESSDERKDRREKTMEGMKMACDKDSENKEFLCKICTLFLVACIVVGGGIKNKLS